METTLDLTSANYGQTVDSEYQIALLPWGAIEPHGLHLPYLTDCYLSQAIGLDAAKLAHDQYGINTMVLPPVTLGQQNPGQRQLKFCMHGRYETQKAILTDIVDSLYHQGLRRLAIINGHGGNCFKNMLRDLAVDYPDMLIAAGEWFSGTCMADYFEMPCDHADEMETSVMLHYYPELVDMAHAGTGPSHGFKSDALRRKVAWLPRDWSRASEDTGIGNPRKATAAKGAAFAKACIQNWADLLRDLCQDDLYQQ